MPTPLRTLLKPLNLAALATMVGVALSLRWAAAQHALAAWSLLAGFASAFIGHALLNPGRPLLGNALLLVMPLLALTMLWLMPALGTPPILLVVWTAVIVIHWPPRMALAAVIAANLGLYAILRTSGYSTPMVMTLLYACFQAFAALCAYYATSAERARDRLVLVNADLLATRALLADSARDAERLRLARELHDVAGHKLTAMILNLRALATDPALAQRTELQACQQLSSELMGDIRDVVHALRDGRGLDLVTALHALAAPMPRPRLHLDIAADLQVTDPDTAETILRVVQEALTNSARHTDASMLNVRLHREGADLRLDIHDDGRVRGALREGNGLTGMRERVTASAGRLAISIAPGGALRLQADLPS